MKKKMMVKLDSLFQYCCFKRKTGPENMPAKPLERKQPKWGPVEKRAPDMSLSALQSSSEDYIHAFTLGELRVITQSFSSANVIGEGEFGPVHKGFIGDQLRPGLTAQPVTVKVLDFDPPQGHGEWLREVIFLGQLRHPNLVKLIGYCCEEEHRLLVYEYMPGGTLDNHLFTSTESIMFDITC